MRLWPTTVTKSFCAGLIAFGMSGSMLTAAAQQVAEKDQPSPAAIELPDSPGATVSNLGQAAVSQNGAWPAEQTQAVQPASQSQQSPPEIRKPVGTAVAEAAHASGVAAAQPAGVAIAPAKQRRTSTLVLKVGAIVGASVALGSVVALSQGTPSKPPGAR